MSKNNQKGFTLIELLVVIAIIGVLSTMAVVALGSARMKSRDAKRVSDMRQIMSALELYYNDAGGYPTTLTTTGSIAVPGGTTYMSIVPANPTPRNDANCPNTDYLFTISTTTYAARYCLGGAVGDVTAGTHYATPAGLVNP